MRTFYFSTDHKIWWKYPVLIAMGLPQITLIIPWDYYTSWKPFLCHLLILVTTTVKSQECSKILSYLQAKEYTFQFYRCCQKIGNSNFGDKGLNYSQHNQQPELQCIWFCSSHPCGPLGWWIWTQKGACIQSRMLSWA